MTKITKMTKNYGVAALRPIYKTRMFDGLQSAVIKSKKRQVTNLEFMAGCFYKNRQNAEILGILVIFQF